MEGFPCVAFFSLFSSISRLRELIGVFTILSSLFVKIVFTSLRQRWFASHFFPLALRF